MRAILGNDNFSHDDDIWDMQVSLESQQSRGILSGALALFLARMSKKNVHLVKKAIHLVNAPSVAENYDAHVMYHGWGIAHPENDRVRR